MKKKRIEINVRETTFLKADISTANDRICVFFYTIRKEISSIKLHLISAILSCITSAMNLIKILTAESQSNDKVYFIIQNLFLILKEKDWIKKYIFWELELLKILGYDLALENLVEKDLEGNKTVYYASSLNEKKYVPNFLIEKDIEVNDLGTLLNGLKLVGDYLDKTILRPNNLNYPNSRLLFLNTLK